MHPTATQVNYFHICRRKLWLFAQQIEMEQHSDAVAEGRLLHEQAYPRRAGRFREIQIGNVKIDFFDPEEKIVHETKKSDKMEQAHVAQVKYYLWLLEQQGVEGVRGRIEYPLLRQTLDVALEPEDPAEILRWIAEIEALTSSPACPPRIRKSFCRACSYHDFCWAGEEPES